MKVIYFFNPTRPENEKNVVQFIYGTEIIYTSEKPWENNMLEEGDILICYSIDELTSTNFTVDEIVKEYMNIFNKNIELIFDKSTQCNSVFIKTLIENNNNFEQVLKKCIYNYVNQHNIDIQYSKKHVITAEANGNKIGIRKGTKRITKKSIIMKERIKKLSRDFDGNINDDELIKKLKISRNSYYRYKKDLKNRRDN